MKKQDGQILLITIVFMSIVATTVVALIGYMGIQIKAHRQAVAREQGLNIAEAGAELAIWKLNHQAGYNGETNTAYANGTYTVTINNLSASTKIIKVDSYVPNQTSPRAHRTIQINTTIGATNIGFDHAIQVGYGGLSMDNNASVTGNIYSNASIIGNGAGLGRPSITSDAFAVGAVTNTIIGGNVTANSISGSKVSKNANIHTALSDTDVTLDVSADTISGCTIFGNAIYNSKTSCTISGTETTPNNNVPAAPQAIPLPIPDAQIIAWQNEASASEINGNVCIGSLPCLPSGTNLGPVKIVGNLDIEGGSTLTLTGTVWVTGNIVVNNGATVELSSSYGSLSGVLMAGTGDSTSGNITASQNAILKGSGATGSYLLLLTQKNDAINTAVDLQNNALSVIVYAGVGVINVSNNAQVREITGYKIHLNNNVILTSSSGTTNGWFTGTGAGWEVLDQTWQLLL